MASLIVALVSRWTLLHFIRDITIFSFTWSMVNMSHCVVHFCLLHLFYSPASATTTYGTWRCCHFLSCVVYSCLLSVPFGSLCHDNPWSCFLPIEVIFASLHDDSLLYRQINTLLHANLTYLTRVIRTKLFIWGTEVLHVWDKWGN